MSTGWESTDGVDDWSRSDEQIRESGVFRREGNWGSSKASRRRLDVSEREYRIRSVKFDQRRARTVEPFEEPESIKNQSVTRSRSAVVDETMTYTLRNSWT